MGRSYAPDWYRPVRGEGTWGGAAEDAAADSPSAAPFSAAAGRGGRRTGPTATPRSDGGTTEKATAALAAARTATAVSAARPGRRMVKGIGAGRRGVSFVNGYPTPPFPRNPQSVSYHEITHPAGMFQPTYALVRNELATYT